MENIHVKSNKNIYIGALSYNRSNEFIQSISSLLSSLEYVNINKQVKIKIFDDFSMDSEFEKIENFCNKHNEIYKNKIELLKNIKNIGYGLNYLSAVDWYSSFEDYNSIFYLHETDLILEKKWFEKVFRLLEFKRDLIISPVHHRNHMYFSKHAKGMYKLFVNEIGLQKVQDNNLSEKWMIKNEGKTIYKDEDFIAKLSYGLIGARVADYKYWQEVHNKKKFILEHEDKEDMALSFLGKDKCTYLIPGSAKIALRKGLHGYMFLNIASFDQSFYRFTSILKIRRITILLIVKIVNILHLKKFIKKLFNY